MNQAGATENSKNKTEKERQRCDQPVILSQQLKRALFHMVYFTL